MVSASQDCVVHTGMCVTIHVDLETFFPPAALFDKAIVPVVLPYL